MDIEIIEDYLIEDLKKKINNNIELMSAIHIFYMQSVINDDDIIERLQNYNDADTKMVYNQYYEIPLPYSPDSRINLIREDAKIKIPNVVISIERIIKKQKEMLLALYQDFKKNIDTANNDDDKIIIRFESYTLGISRKQYIIKSNDILFDKVLPSDGKKFLPFIN